MEISRGYEPLFKTNVKGLAKVNLEPREKLSIEEIHQLIAVSALKSNDDFFDYKMRVYDDTIRFKKNKDGLSFPEIHFASILYFVTLPNFPDVCFIQFRQSTYEMYVILRFTQVKYISKVAKFICSWSNANASDTEGSVTSSTESTLQNTDKGPRGKETKANKQPPVIVHRPKYVVDGPKSKYPRSGHENTTKTLKTEGTQTVVKESHSNKSTYAGPSHPVRAKSVLPNAVKRANSFATKRNHSQPAPQKPKKDPHRRLSFTESSVREDETTEDSEVNVQWQPGEYTIIVPTHRGWPPPKNLRKRKVQQFSAPTHRKGVERRVKTIISDDTTFTSSTTSTNDLVDMHGRGVKTIYPSHMEPSRMSPRSRRNERLLYKLHAPLSL
ncbi:hypothetical protein TcWFU_003298 [Taenia crassiceps]|uniref:DUF5733 domain-containing protein n=1 Tax=Taenia crassiceps TaxID=6207 RepID=A0ABR4Q2E7_9CEST